MGLFDHVKLADIYLRLYKGDLKGISKYNFYLQKERFEPGRRASTKIAYSTPEEQGISSLHLNNFFKDLRNLNDVNIHHVMVLRHGMSISRSSFYPYLSDYPHMVYSMSKSVVSMAIGIAIDEGYLSVDDKLIDIFPDEVASLHDSKLNELKVWHLLTMTAGIKFSEINSLIDKNWVSKFMHSEIIFAPGERFYYNSMNSYMLSAIIYKKTGTGLTEFLGTRLFEPLGINSYYWERCPMGIEKGGWGLYLCIEDIAKLGQLYLQKGAWVKNDKKIQIIPQDWVETSTTAQVDTGQNRLASGYGYQIWTFPVKGAFQFNGMFGQYVVVIPEHDIVIALTSGSQNLLPHGPALEVIYKYFSDNTNIFDKPLKRNKKALNALNKTLKQIGTNEEDLNQEESLKNIILQAIGKNNKLMKMNFIDRILNISKFIDESSIIFTKEEISHNNSEYIFDKNSASILPFVIQCSHGNFNDGLSNIKLKFLDDAFVINIEEGMGSKNCIKSGKNGNYIYGDININGEVYTIASTSKWTTNEDDKPILKVFISFIETPCTRILKIAFWDEEISIKFEESPSTVSAIKMLLPKSKKGYNDKLILKRGVFSNVFINSKLNTFLLPELIGKIKK